ncbi:MAG: hypothetical protein M3Y56_04210 [Armatimonadota bacterium]|nr:hypothetical protein [Armatimonadota bacterium]
MKLRSLGKLGACWILTAAAVGMLAGCGSGDGGSPSPVGTTGSTTSIASTGGSTGGGLTTGSTSSSIATTGGSTDGSGSAGGTLTGAATGGSIVIEPFGTTTDVTTGGFEPKYVATSSAVSPSAPIQDTARIMKNSLARGEEISGVITYKNIGTSPLQYVLQTGDLSLTVGYQVSAGSKVYFSTLISRQSNPIRYTSTLNPGEAQDLQFWWDQRDQQGNLLPPGQYTIQVWWSPASFNGTALTPAQAQAQFSVPPMIFTIQDGPEPDFTPPLPVTDLKAVVQANGSVHFSWTPVPGIFGYQVYRRTSGESYQYIGPSTGTSEQPSYTDSPPAGTYFYTVGSYRDTYNVQSTSAPSNEVSVTVSPPVTVSPAPSNPNGSLFPPFPGRTKASQS